jgi:hypothetical protein
MCMVAHGEVRKFGVAKQISYRILEPWMTGDNSTASLGTGERFRDLTR